MRRMTLSFAMLVAASPLLAQGMGGMNMDAPKTGLTKAPLAPGWMEHMDIGDTLLIGNFAAMGTGFHINSNGHAIYYNPKDMASGDYTVSATFSQTKTMGHEAYGIFIGGSNLQDYAKQDYLYFDIRPVDGQILITHRVGIPRSKPQSSRSREPRAERRRQHRRPASTRTARMDPRRTPSRSR